MKLTLGPIALLSACCFLAAGCSSDPPPEFSDVTGVLTINGVPRKGLIVTFMPDPAGGKELSINSSGETDDSGKYELRHVYQGQEGKGAAVGRHRVTIYDPRFAAIQQGQQAPPRLFSNVYGNPSKTPLSFDVKSGPQTIDLKIN